MFKGALYYKLENAMMGTLGPTLRGWGQSLFRSGCAAQAHMGHEDTMVPSMRCIPISNSKFPRLLEVSFHKLLTTLFIRPTGLPPTQL